MSQDITAAGAAQNSNERLALGAVDGPCAGIRPTSTPDPA